MRALEFGLRFPSISRLLPDGAPAHLTQRERLMLYAFVFGLAPRRCLEIGSFYGGSALITSGALDDVQRGGRLLCIDPDPSQIKIDWSVIAHNAELIGGFFPKDLPPLWLGEPIKGLFEFIFYDGPHTEAEGVQLILPYVVDLMATGGYLLIHDAYHVDTRKAVSALIRDHQLIDCGMVSRTCNNNHPGAFFGGMVLVRKSGELPPNSD